jgi:hypothetical protein
MNIGFPYRVYLTALKREDELDEAAIIAFLRGWLPVEAVDGALTVHEQRRSQGWAQLEALGRVSRPVALLTVHRPTTTQTPPKRVSRRTLSQPPQRVSTRINKGEEQCRQENT